jgi:hypothetical protein
MPPETNEQQPASGLKLSDIIATFEARRVALKTAHDQLHLTCLAKSSDLKAAEAERDDTAARHDELSAQIIYLRSLTTQQQPAA